MRGFKGLWVFRVGFKGFGIYGLGVIRNLRGVIIGFCLRLYRVLQVRGLKRPLIGVRVGICDFCCEGSGLYV